MKSVVIFSKAGCSFCAALAREYTQIQADLAKLGISLVIWSQDAKGAATLKYPKGQRVGPSPLVLGIQGQFPMPAIFLVDDSQWNPADPSTDHAFIRSAVALFDGAIIRTPTGGYELKHYGRLPRNRANVLSWAKGDHSLPPAAPRPVAPVEAAAPSKGRTTCSTRFVSAASNTQRRR